MDTIFQLLQNVKIMEGYANIRQALHSGLILLHNFYTLT